MAMLIRRRIWSVQRTGDPNDGFRECKTPTSCATSLAMEFHSFRKSLADVERRYAPLTRDIAIATRPAILAVADTGSIVNSAC